MQQRYHTNLKIKCALGLLEPNVAALIPNSTQQYWKSIDINSYFNIDDSHWDKSVETLKYACGSKKLFCFIRTVKTIEETANIIFNNLKNINRTLRNCRTPIVNAIDKIKSVTGLEKALSIFRITRHQYRFWRKGVVCNSSPLNLCRKIYYNQLTLPETTAIKKYLFATDTLHWPLVSRYYHMLRHKAAYLSLPTFYKYANLMGATGRLKVKNKTPREGLRADKPLQIIHTDLTEIRIKDRLKVYVSLVIDNYSRTILAWSVSATKQATVTMKNLEKVYFMYLADKPPAQLIVDGGSENKGVTDTFLQTTTIEKLVAQTEISFSNSMVEAVNKKLKYEYWPEPHNYDIDSFTRLTEKAVVDYNNRPHGELKGLTPFEALKTDIDCPSYIHEIHLAAQKRPSINKNDNCNLCKA